MIQIKHLNGTLVHEMEIPEGAIVHRELMGEHYIRLHFSVGEPVYLKLGDYVQTNFGRFELTKPYAPKYNTTTDGYDYDIQLDAYYIKWKNKKCRYSPQNAASETSFHLTATVDVHLQVIANNINALGQKDSNYRYNGQEFVFQLKGFDGGNSAKYIQYQDTDIISALDSLASVYECEWWVEDNIIFFGRCEIDGDAEAFEVNDNVSEMRSSESDAEYATRIYAYGSTRNLPKDYRKDSSVDVTKNGVVQKRLMLPASSCPNGYMQDSSVNTETEAVEAVLVTEDIYPRTKCKVSAVETYTDTYKDEDTGEEVEQTFYRITDGSGFKFSTDYILEGETLHILFQSGKMNGMDFECKYNEEKKYYEVVANEDYGRILPDTSLHPEVGDEFVLYNWDATKIGNTTLISAAEKELETFIRKRFERMKIDPNTYTCKMDSYWYDEARRLDEKSFAHYSMGQKVELVNAQSFDKPRKSRIIGYEIKLDIEYDTPEYIVGEATAYSKRSDLQNQIDSITVNGSSYTGGNGGTGGGQYLYVITTTSSTVENDTNVYSAARVKKQYADRINDENISALWTLLKGLVSKGDVEVGDFVSGYFGKGALIDTKGNVEVESLFSRSFISTPEFRFNRISVTEGENWCTNGFGTIADVDVETQTITLKLEDNEYASVKVGDICRGIYNDVANTYNTATTDKDECGFSSKMGFFTSYFTITEMVKYDKGECVFKYRLRNDATPHPCKFMKFAQYGSFTDEDRQCSSYSTSIGHYYEEVLEGVNTWVISDPHIVYRHGWLGTMRVTLRNGNTAQLKGNGLYVQDNVYFGNAIVQLDPVTLSDLQKQLELYTVEFSDYTDVITVDAVGNVIGGLYKADKDADGNIIRKYDYRIHSAIYVKRGNDFLSLADANEDAGNGTYKIHTQCDGCECYIDNSTLYITSIKDVKDGIAGTADDTTFDYDAMRNRESILVTLTIDCEGIGTISRAFPVAIKHDSQPFIGADIENEFSSVSWNTKEQKYIGLPIKFKYRMWRNNELLDITDLAIDGIDSNYWSSAEVVEDGVKCREITIDNIPKDFALVTNINITGTCEYAGISYERTLVHTINKTTDTNVFSLEPSESSVHVSYDDKKHLVLGVNKVFCNVICNSIADHHYIVPLTELSTYGLSFKYAITDTDGNTSAEADYPSAGIDVTTSMASIKFILHITGQSDIFEDVPILLDGLDGDNSVRLALDNENDNCLALEDGTVIQSTLPVTHAALFDGDTLVTQAQHEANDTWQNLICTGCTAEYGNYRADGWREIKVKTVTDISAQVIVPCNYTTHGVVISTKAILTIKKDIGTDKYEIITNPASVAYNPNTEAFKPESVAVSVYKTTRETPRTLLEALPSGFSLMYSTDGGNTWTSLTYGNAITKSMMNVDGVENIQLRLREAVTKNGSTSYVVRDLESIDIVGDGLDGKGVEHVFFCHDSESKPSLYDDSSSTAFQADDYCPYTDKARSQRWTDEPTGVGANSKYEFYAMRKQVKGVWQAFGEVKLWNRYAVDGDSPYILDLSNEQSLVNCEEDGTVIGSYEPTEIMLFMGGADCYDKFNIEITPTNIGYTINGRVITPKDITSDAATIAVKATLKTNSSIYLTAVYSVNKTYKGKNGVIYSLVPSLNVIKKDADGNFIDTSFSVQVKKTIGTSASLLSTKAEFDAEGLALKYKIGSTYTAITNPSSISTSTVCGSNNYCDIYLYKVDTVIDREKINCVKDGENGDDGQSVFTSRMFKRGVNVTDKPTGGSFDSPVGTGTGWSDGIPSGTQPIWMSSRIFTSDGEVPQQSAWTSPVILADSPDTDICFHDATSNGAAPTAMPVNHGTQTAATDNGWYNNATTSSVWMAVSYKNEGTWGAWSVMRVVGEKGDDGDDALSFNISNLNIVGKKGETKIFYIQVKVSKGETELAYGSGVGDSFVCSTLSSSSKTGAGMSWGYSTPNNTTFQYYYIHNGSEFSEDIPFTVTVNGIEYNFVIHVTTVSNGEKGNDGDNGYALINRGIWNANGYYPSNNGYSYKKVGKELIRDEVIHTIGGVPYVFMVKNRTDLSGTNVPVTAEPSLDSSYWEVGSIYQLLFANCLFADNANIGGFIITNMLLRSQTPAYRVQYRGEHKQIGFKLNYKGGWSASATYEYDYKGYSIYPCVNYNGIYYRFKSSSSQNTSTNPASDTTNWQDCSSDFLNNRNSDGFVPKESGKTYEYSDGSNYEDGVPVRPLVLYSGKYYVVKRYGSSVFNSAPHANSYDWREATDEELAAASSSDKFAEISTLTLNGTNGTLAMRQADDSIWTCDPSGKQTMGISNGMRIEISPSSKDISIYNSNNKQVISINGESKSMSSIFPSSVPASFTYSDVSKGYNGDANYGRVIASTEYITNTFSLSTGTFTFSISCSLTSIANVTTRDHGMYDNDRSVSSYTYPYLKNGYWVYENRAHIELHFGKVENGTFTSLKKIDTLDQGDNGMLNSKSVNTTFSISVNSTGTYVFAVVYRCVVYSGSNNTAMVTCKDASVICTTGNYLGNIFANGLAFGSSTGNFFAAINDSNNMHVKAMTNNGQNGFELSASGGFKVCVNGVWKNVSTT